MTAPVGVHCVLELHDCSRDFLDDRSFLRDSIIQAAMEAGATLLNLVSHQFSPHGVTVIALLAESHLSIHTWPEHGYAAVDLFTCGQAMTPKKACEYLVSRLGARRHSLVMVPRGGGLDQLQLSFEEAVLCPTRD